jgi:hypothetical protein
LQNLLPPCSGFWLGSWVKDGSVARRSLWIEGLLDGPVSPIPSNSREGEVRSRLASRANLMIDGNRKPNTAQEGKDLARCGPSLLPLGDPSRSRVPFSDPFLIPPEKQTGASHFDAKRGIDIILSQKSTSSLSHPSILPRPAPSHLVMLAQSRGSDRRRGVVEPRRATGAGEGKGPWGGQGAVGRARGRGEGKGRGGEERGGVGWGGMRLRKQRPARKCVRPGVGGRDVELRYVRRRRDATLPGGAPSGGNAKNLPERGAGGLEQVQIHFAATASPNTASASASATAHSSRTAPRLRNKGPEDVDSSFRMDCRGPF